MFSDIYNWLVGIINNQYAGWAFACILIIFGIISQLSKTVTGLQSLKASILMPFTRWFGYKRLAKSAIKNDIEGNVNKVVNNIRSELPDGWAEPLAIEWVSSESTDSFIKDNKTVIRVRPVKDQASNFANAVYLYFSNSFFPKVKSIIPETHTEAAVLQFSRRVILEGKPSSLESFENEVLEPSLQRNSGISKYLERLQKIDDKGLLTGVFIREVHNIALKIRFTGKRQTAGSEFSEVLSHLEEFTEGVQSKNKLQDYQWSRKGPVCSYGLVLVAMPAKAASGEINGYVNRAKEKAEKKVDHLYVFGTSEEIKFADEVIKNICEKVPEYELKQKFNLHKDYRGKKGGIGALFTLKD